MKLFTATVGLLGLLLMTVLVLHSGFAEILDLLVRAGWSLLWLVPFHVIPVLLDAQGWRTLLRPADPQHRATLAFLFWVATVREAVGRVLPTANIGGDLIGIRLARLRVPDGAAVAASVVVEILLALIAQVLFVVLALAWLLLASPASDLAWRVLAGMALTLPVLALLGMALRFGSVFGRLQKMIARMLGPHSEIARLIDGANLDTAILKLVSQRGRLARSLGWQFAGMAAGSFETWLALRLLGHEVPLATAIALEALTQAIRHFIFIAPAGLGVQEAGLLAFGRRVGLGDEVSLSLSLAKRARELIFSVAPLLSWQVVESLRLRRHLRSTVDPAAS